MTEEDLEIAKREIAKTLNLTTFALKFIGISFENAKTMSEYFRLKILFFISAVGILYHFMSELIYIFILITNNPSIEDVVPLLHTSGYGVLSGVKFLILWYKRDVFAKLIEDLSTIWPAKTSDKELQDVKDKSLTRLDLAHKWYFFINLTGVWFYNLTPIFSYFLNKIQGNDVPIGFVWVCWYPFNKYQPLNHVIAYLVEINGGLIAVWITVGSDLLFSAMANHLCLLLRLLQRRLISLTEVEKSDDEYYAEIASNIKLHQRLIKHCNDLEEAFSFVLLVNIVLSAVVICCVVFVIMLLEPFLMVSNKLFLASAMLQLGVICWYADDIIRANAEVGDAAYKSGWYRTSPRCRIALLFLIKRSQKPIALTAMKFTNISLLTYTSTLTRSYSYFTLLYTMFKQK